MSVVEGYIPALVFAIVGTLFGFAILFVSSLIRPTNPEKQKYMTYESGIVPTGDANIMFNVQFYLFAIIFAVFDVETIFLYPWALTFTKLGLFALVEMFVFITILLIGLAYAWKKGALEWT